MSLCTTLIFLRMNVSKVLRIVKPVKKVPWLFPPSGVLKLNFDDSFIKEAQGQFGSNLLQLFWSLFLLELWSN